MTQDETGRQHYYQEIARRFLRHQTSMFFLPPRDLALISDWEKLGIPLEPILEGIDRTFSRQLKRKKKRNIYSLSQCEREILKAYASYQERLIGQTSPPIEPDKKINKARAEIEAFLKGLPTEFEKLNELYKVALEILNKSEPDENKLEELDEEIDRFVFQLIPEEEKKAGLKEIRREFPGKLEAVLTEIQQTRLVKEKRQLYHLPYVSLFYY